MKPVLLALLGSVAIAAVPVSVMAQVAMPTLNCDPEDSDPSLDNDESVFDGGDGVSSGGVGFGSSGGSSGGEPANPNTPPSATNPTTSSGGTPAPGTVQPIPPSNTNPTTPGTGAGAGAGIISGPGTVGTPGGPGTDTGGPGGVNLSDTPAKPPAYVTNGNVAQMTTSKNSKGTVFYRTKPDATKKQDLAKVKTYPAPNGGGVSKTIGGQKILAKDGNVKTAGLSQGIINIIDEINLTAAAIGLPDPVITAGFDLSGHSAGSKHYSGNALDLRCNFTYGSPTACKKWVIAMQNAFGSKYDVTWEDHGPGDGNSHIHLSYNG